MPNVDMQRRADGTRPIDNEQFVARLADIRRDCYLATADRFTTAPGMHNKLCREVIHAIDRLEAHSRETPEEQ